MVVKHGQVLLTTDHGTIETPIFMPVGTAGSVKGIHKRDLKEDIAHRLFSEILIICICALDCQILSRLEVCTNLMDGMAQF